MRLPLPASIKGLVTLIVILALLPAVGLIVAAGYKNIQAGLADVERDSLRIVASVTRQQTRLVESTRVLLLTLSQLPEVRNKDADRCSILFQNLLLHAPAYVNLRLCDTDGYTVASADPEPVQLSVTERRQFIASGVARTFLVHELPRGYGYGAAVLNCRFPVRDGKETVGVLVATIKIDINEVSRQRLHAPYVDHLYIADKKGQLIYGYPPESIPAYKGGHDHDESWQTIQNSPERYGSFYNSDGEHIVFSKLTKKTGGAPDLTIVLLVRTAAVYSGVLTQVLTNIFLLGAVLVVAILISLYICKRSLLAPVRRLLGTANRIKEGNLEARVGAGGMAQELRILSDSLDTMSGSLALRDKELMAMRDAADIANQSKTSFLATMSHEIRTPMNAILGMTYLTRQGDLSEQQRGYLDNIHAEAGKLLVIINDILDFSKIEAGKLHIELVPFSLREMFAELARQAREEAEKKEIAFTLALDAALPQTALGDPVHLSQLVGNIVNNGIRVTLEGEVSLACRAEAASAETFVLECVVTDTAGGMGEDEMELFFPDREPVTRLTTFDGGFGLNMAVTRRLARLMDAGISVSTEPGVGSSVVVRVPLRAGELPEGEEGAGAPEPVAPDPLPEEAGGSIEGVRILLVDDNLINQQVAGEILHSLGAVVRVASNGLEALEALRGAGEAFDLVLMDLQMPEMDGFAATRQIREDANIADIPVIAMSAQTRQEEWDRCREAGMDDYISKPINVPDLQATIVRYTAGKPRAPR